MPKSTDKAVQDAEEAARLDREASQAKCDAEEKVRAAREAYNPDAITNAGSVVHTYPDGSQRVGAPPFPEKSPNEEAADLGESGPGGKRGMHVPRGRETSGETPPNEAGYRTESEFEARAREQLTSNVLGGFDPATPNPTTSSDKPGLASATGESADYDEVLSTDPTQEELEAIAAKIEPKGDIEATDEDKLAAVQQVARETKGPVIADTKDTGKKSAK